MLVHEFPHLLACKLPWLRLLGPPIAIEVCRTLPAAKLMLGSSDVLPKIFLHTAFNAGHNQGCRPVCLATVAFCSRCDNQTTQWIATTAAPRGASQRSNRSSSHLVNKRA